MTKLSVYYGKVDDGPHANISLVLDPRTKMEYHARNIWDARYIEVAKEMLINEHQYYVDSNIHAQTNSSFTAAAASTEAPETTNASPSSSTNALFEQFLDELYGDQDYQHADNEIDRYLSAAVVRRVDPLNWWKTNSGEFPVLSRIARDYFATPGNNETDNTIRWIHDTDIYILFT